MRQARSVMVIAVLPPPVNGMTRVTQAAVDALATAIGDGLVVHTVRRPSGLRWRRGWSAYRQVGLLVGLARLLSARCRGVRVLYIVPDASASPQTVLVPAVARALGVRVVAHHHVRSYLDQPSRLMRWFVRMAPPRSRHIVLCECLGTKLQEGYGPGLDVVILSNNPVLSSGPAKAPVRDHDPFDGKLRVGLLGNLTLEKGIDVFLRILMEDTIRAAGVVGVIAGPVVDRQASVLVNDAVRSLGRRLEVLGPLGEPGKDAFFESIDLLVFPSRYRNESQPLVVFEAIRRGVPVLGLDIGCVREQVGSGGWIEADEAGIVSRLKSLLAEPALVARASAEAAGRAVEAPDRWGEQLVEFVLS